MHLFRQVSHNIKPGFPEVLIETYQWVMSPCAVGHKVGPHTYPVSFGLKFGTIPEGSAGPVILLVGMMQTGHLQRPFQGCTVPATHAVGLYRLQIGSQKCPDLLRSSWKSSPNLGNNAEKMMQAFPLAVLSCNNKHTSWHNRNG